jgi:hypothetical protein
MANNLRNSNSSGSQSFLGAGGPPGPAFPQSNSRSGGGSQSSLSGNTGGQNRHKTNENEYPHKKKKHKPKVRGLARRKGEWKPWHYGLDFDDKYLGHPAVVDSRPLPPLEGYPKVRCKGCGEEKKECVVM